ncbi:HUL4 [Cyberlindnera jadinii]|uniref:HECT-type E3 ubiquitin transferase n=1 Tax=Cyberlindnera jadinii (strain ATCC 18201 / CBS 1600 / BCRC 20928 / JCM 3617 / NBRC 0987 / NRRL Y-1542) TaxID=983966 RepID=A0A0H5CFN3_CYBJN|nr:HUL4 [Cyberlindnera jadinii]
MLKFFQFGSTQEGDSTSLSSEMSGEGCHGEAGRTLLDHCRCCGTLIKYPESVTKYKCSVCHSTQSTDKASRPSHDDLTLDLNTVLDLDTQCKLNLAKGMDLHSAYEPLERYLTVRFGSLECLKNSFKTHLGNRPLDINNEELYQLYRIVISLPTRRPYVKLLMAVNETLLRPQGNLDSLGDIRSLLILWELPTLKHCLYHSRKPTKKVSRLETPEIKSLSYEIVKRVIGYLSNADLTLLSSLTNFFHSWTTQQLASKVQLLNLYITFHLTRIVNAQSSMSAFQSSSPNLSEYSNSSKLNSSSDSSACETLSRVGSLNVGARLPRSISLWNDRSTSIFPTREQRNEKLKVSQYGNDWHIKSASRLLSMLFVANNKQLPVCAFYNVVSDHILLKQDFDVWQSSFKKPEKNDPNRVLREILNCGTILGDNNTSRIPQFTFCQFPFLLSLGAKISILEYESKKSMERMAEEAFIHALDNRVPTSVNVVFHIRRSHITDDSLRCIKQHQNELKKALKIEFVGEPGVDAGGLKKEWFQLLIRDLFKQDNGMFLFNSESRLCWFAPEPSEKNDELFFLVGVILGLAIYNSTILDLKFPLALYKKLLGKSIHLDDYTELCPSTGEGLRKLLHCDHDEVEEMGIYFETSFQSGPGEVITRELCPNGSKRLVTHESRREYVNRWVDFYMNRSIEEQFNSFNRGFQMIIGGNAISLFAPREIEMIICGNGDTRIDVSSLKSITKYNGWSSSEEASNSQLIKWFWEWVETLNNAKQKQFLCFVTGSGRIPATGITTMSFKITRLKSYGTSTRLPMAHTCFNELCLFEYRSREEMFRKLNISISESEGFGLR